MQLNKARVLDVGRWRPPQRLVKVVNERGVAVEAIEKYPGMRFEKWLNPAGVVVSLPLGCCNIESEEGRTPLFEQKKRAKLSAGLMPWGRCPLALVASQEMSSRNFQDDRILEQSPCMGAANGKPISADNPCQHVVAERNHRKAKHTAREQARAEAHRQEHERDREQRDTQHRQMLEAMSKGQELIADALVKNRAGGEKK
jgi:hypothetical protein